jgi:hypothetical protein
MPGEPALEPISDPIRNPLTARVAAAGSNACRAARGVTPGRARARQHGSESSRAGSRSIEPWPNSTRQAPLAASPDETSMARRA